MADLVLDRDFDDAGPPVSIEKAARLLSQRFSRLDVSQAWSMGNSQPYQEDYLASGVAPTMSVNGTGATAAGIGIDQANLFMALAEALPENMRTEAVLTGGDLRALLNNVQGQGEIDDLEPTTYNGVTFDSRMRRLAGAILVSETVERTGKYEEALQGRGLSPEAIATQVQEFRRGYTEGRVLRLPEPTGGLEIDPSTGLPAPGADASADVSDAGLFDANKAAEGTAQDVEPFEYLTRDEVRQLLQESSDNDSNVGRLLEYEQAGLDAPEGTQITGAPTRVVYSQSERPGRAGQLAPGANTNAQRGYEEAVGRKTMGLSEVVRLPSTMTRAEITALSKKLEKGGYYDLAGGKPVTIGDPTDPVFKRAWRLLVGQSVESGKPMMSLLTDRMKAYQDQIDDALVTKLTDPARIRMSVDAVGRNMLGRKLRPDEHDDMVTFVHELERRNARLEAGLSPDGDEEGDEEMIMADIEARIDEEMRGTNETEALSHDVAGQYDVFSNLLRGPGRGI